MARDGFVFYRSFADVYRNLDDKQKIMFIDMILDYALDDVEPDGDGLLVTMFALIRPQIDANNRRYENGKKGGRPKKETEEEKQKRYDEAIKEARRNRRKT